MTLEWLPQALEDLKSIQQHIAVDNPSAANRIVAATVSMVHDQLMAYPGSGRPGRIEGTRELMVPKSPLIVAYRISGRIAGPTIQILAVHHASRLSPDTL